MVHGPTAIPCPSILAFMINNLITSRNIRVYATTYIHKFLDLTARNHDLKCTTFLGHVIISMQPPRFWCKYAKHTSNQNINVLKCVNILMWDFLHALLNTLASLRKYGPEIFEDSLGK